VEKGCISGVSPEQKESKAKSKFVVDLARTARRCFRRVTDRAKTRRVKTRRYTDVPNFRRFLKELSQVQQQIPHP
jgi:hypothetical protein